MGPELIEPQLMRPELTEVEIYLIYVNDVNLFC